MTLTALEYKLLSEVESNPGLVLFPDDPERDLEGIEEYEVFFGLEKKGYIEDTNKSEEEINYVITSKGRAALKASMSKVRSGETSKDFEKVSDDFFYGQAP